MIAHILVISIFIFFDLIILVAAYSVDFILGLICTVAMIGIDIVVLSVLGGIKLVQLLM